MATNSTRANLRACLRLTDLTLNSRFVLLTMLEMPLAEVQTVDEIRIFLEIEDGLIWQIFEELEQKNYVDVHDEGGYTLKYQLAQERQTLKHMVEKTVVKAKSSRDRNITVGQCVKEIQTLHNSYYYKDLNRHTMRTMRNAIKFVASKYGNTTCLHLIQEFYKFAVPHLAVEANGKQFMSYARQEQDKIAKSQARRGITS